MSLLELLPPSWSAASTDDIDLRRRRRNGLKQLYRGNTSALERSNLAGKTGMNHAIDDASRGFLGVDHVSQKDIMSQEEAERRSLLSSGFTEKDLRRHDAIMAAAANKVDPLSFPELTDTSNTSPFLTEDGASPCFSVGQHSVDLKSALRTSGKSDKEAAVDGTATTTAAAGGGGGGPDFMVRQQRRVSFRSDGDGSVDPSRERRTFPTERFQGGTPPDSPRSPGGSVSGSRSPVRENSSGKSDDTFMDTLVYGLLSPRYLRPNLCNAGEAPMRPLSPQVASGRPVRRPVATPNA